MQKNIAVITGGDASEVGISLKSASVICKHLNKEKYKVYKIVINGIDWRHEDTGTLINKSDFSMNLNGEKIKFDASFVAIHGTPAEDGKLQGYFELIGIPYNCCNVLSAALTFDKMRCKEYLSSFGVLVAKGIILDRDNFNYNQSNILKDFLNSISFPLFVKPNKNGSSYGASKVDSIEKLESSIEDAFKYDNEILVEEFLKGTEVTCGMITQNQKIIAFPLTEIRSKGSFFDYQAKYEGNSSEITPAEIDSNLAQRIQETSKFIYKKLGFKGMCRIDYIICNDQYYMLEVNSIPGLSEESIVPQQAKAYGLSLEDLFEITVSECLNSKTTNHA